MADPTIYRRSLAESPEFVTSVRSVLDAIANLDEDAIRLLSLKVQPHQLLWMSLDIANPIRPSLTYSALNKSLDCTSNTALVLRNNSSTTREHDQSFNRRVSNLAPTILVSNARQYPAHADQKARRSRHIDPPSQSSKVFGIVRGTYDRNLGDLGDQELVQDTEENGNAGTYESPPPSSYLQAFHSMRSLFSESLSVAKLPLIIQMGDKLIRNDAVSFLTNNLPEWKGLWYKSDLPAPVLNDTATVRFVKVSRCVAATEERSNMDRIRIMLQKLLQYRSYLECLEEIRHDARKKQQKRNQGVRDSVCAINYLLQCLHPSDWNSVGKAEETRRRNLFHKQKHIGKRLHLLSKCMGLGIFLLGCPAIMGRINDPEFTDKMFDAFVTYTLNVYTNIPLLGEKLSDIVRRLISGQAVQGGEWPKSLLSEIDLFLQRRDGIVPPLKFRLVEPGSVQAESSELYNGFG